MDVIKTFGNYVEKWCEGHPERARWLLKTGWEAENLKFTVAPSKRNRQWSLYHRRTRTPWTAGKTGQKEKRIPCKASGKVQ